MTIVKLYKEKKILADNNYFKQYSLFVTNWSRQNF